MILNIQFSVSSYSDINTPIFWFKLIQIFSLIKINLFLNAILISMRSLKFEKLINNMPTNNMLDVEYSLKNAISTDWYRWNYQVVSHFSLPYNFQVNLMYWKWLKVTKLIWLNVFQCDSVIWLFSLKIFSISFRILHDLISEKLSLKF